MTTFWELLKQSVIVQALITLILTGVIAYMYIAQIAIPNELFTIYGIVVGYYFGSKTQQYINKV